MSVLVIRHQQGWLRLPIPYFIYINNQLVGYMRGEEVKGNLPPGKYRVDIKLLMGLWKWNMSLSSSVETEVGADETKVISFGNREQWWDVLFNIDLAVWLLSFLFTIPHPWNIVYHVLSEGFFVAWLVRLWYIRKRYFELKVYSLTD